LEYYFISCSRGCVGLFVSIQIFYTCEDESILFPQYIKENQVVAFKNFINTLLEIFSFLVFK
jgi:hypothetical protein